MGLNSVFLAAASIMYFVNFYYSQAQLNLILGLGCAARIIIYVITKSNKSEQPDVEPVAGSTSVNPPIGLENKPEPFIKMTATQVPKEVPPLVFVDLKPRASASDVKSTASPCVIPGQVNTQGNNPDRPLSP